MLTKVDEIGPRIYRLSTLVPDIGPSGFTFNQFLLDDDELCGDLFTHPGDGPALTERDILQPAADAEDLFGYSTLAPGTPQTFERLAALEPSTPALMRGSSFTGQGAAALRALARS